MDLALLSIYVGLALGLSFLCSLLEAALLSVRVATLTERKKSGNRGAGLLLDFKQHKLDDAISSILTLNTISNTAGASLAGYQFKLVFESVPVAIFSGLLTFLVLAFSEIIPKNLGAVHAARLSGFVGHAVAVLIKTMTPILVLTRTLTRLVTRGEKHRISRGELAAIVALAWREGTLEQHESVLFHNVLRFEEIHIDDVMTPRTVAVMVSADSTIADLLENGQAAAFSRIPIYRHTRDNVLGYVLQREVLLAVARGAPHETLLTEFLRDVWFIPEVASMLDALRQFQEHREPMAMALDEHGGVSGLVTLEDLMETILGVEIMDESDLVPDLRKVAVRLRDRRLERLQKGNPPYITREAAPITAHRPGAEDGPSKNKA